MQEVEGAKFLKETLREDRLFGPGGRRRHADQHLGSQWGTGRPQIVIVSEINSLPGGLADARLGFSASRLSPARPATWRATTPTRASPSARLTR